MNIKSPKFKSKIQRVLFLTGGWVIAAIYIHIIQFAAVILTVGSQDFSSRFIESLILTAVEVSLAGLALASFEVFYFTDRFKNRSFGYAVLMRSLFYAGSLTLLTFLISYIESMYIREFYIDFFANMIPILFMTFFIWTPIFLISFFLLQVSDKYGQGVLLKFIFGKYHAPKEETRIFMFLDMKSSTSIAEALGNVKYFELLNDFFFDVTDAIIENSGEIYQYVGDEIVISWKLNGNMTNVNSLNCFFDIHNIIRRYSEKYQSKYGLVPSFKAGIHYGDVTVGEIGVLKRDITFSGDVLNTTSRIQELCNKYNEKLIVSKNFIDLLKLQNNFALKEIGQMNLRGKSEPIVLYSVKQN